VALEGVPGCLAIPLPGRQLSAEPENAPS